jgi:hypothetical protein
MSFLFLPLSSLSFQKRFGYRLAAFSWVNTVPDLAVLTRYSLAIGAYSVTSSMQTLTTCDSIHNDVF